jgi:chemotaxis signal transduction protein
MQASENPAVAPEPERAEAILFELRERSFAVALGDVLELTRACVLRALPKAPRPVLGALNLRGAVLPVIDHHDA